MLVISSKAGLKPMKIIGGLIAFFVIYLAILSYWRAGTIPALDLTYGLMFSYFFWGMYAKTEIHPTQILKKRGWLFPNFKSKYNQFKRIELQSRYIQRHEAGISSYHALYVGIINGGFNDFVDLSWGVNSTEKGGDYTLFTKKLEKLTSLPITVTDEFKLQFKLKFGYEFTCN